MRETYTEIREETQRRSRDAMKVVREERGRVDRGHSECSRRIKQRERAERERERVREREREKERERERETVEG